MSNEKLKYEIPEHVINNIMCFLDKVRDYSGGLKDVQAMSEILYILNNPIVDEKIGSKNHFVTKE